MIKEWRVVLTVREIRWRCPKYEVGDKLTLEFPEMTLNETDIVCLHVIPCMMHFVYASAKGVLIRETGLAETEEKSYVQCPDFGPIYTSGEIVILR